MAQTETQERKEKRDLTVEWLDFLMDRRFHGVIEISFKDGFMGTFPHENRVVNLESWKRRNELKKKGIVETKDNEIINDSKVLTSLKDLENISESKAVKKWPSKI